MYFFHFSNKEVEHQTQMAESTSGSAGAGGGSAAGAGASSGPTAPKRVKTELEEIAAKAPREIVQYVEGLGYVLIRSATGTLYLYYKGAGANIFASPSTEWVYKDHRDLEPSGFRPFRPTVSRDLPKTRAEMPDNYDLPNRWLIAFGCETDRRKGPAYYLGVMKPMAGAPSWTTVADGVCATFDDYFQQWQMSEPRQDAALFEFASMAEKLFKAQGGRLRFEFPMALETESKQEASGASTASDSASASALCGPLRGLDVASAPGPEQQVASSSTANLAMAVTGGATPGISGVDPATLQQLVNAIANAAVATVATAIGRMPSQMSASQQPSQTALAPSVTLAPSDTAFPFPPTGLTHSPTPTPTHTSLDAGASAASVTGGAQAMPAQDSSANVNLQERQL